MDVLDSIGEHHVLLKELDNCRLYQNEWEYSKNVVTA